MEENCRLCRKTANAFYETIHSYHGQLQISDIIMKVCPMITEIASDDGLPTRVCEECLEILLAAYDLQKTSVESDNFYRSLGTATGDIFVKQEKPETSTSFQIKVEKSFDTEFVAEAYEESNGNDFSDSFFKNEKQELKSSDDLQAKTRFNPRPVIGMTKATAHFDRYYQCNFCDTQLKPRQNLIRHMKLKHDPIEKPFGCQFCIQRFGDKAKKDLHEKNIHDLSEVPSTLFCEICGATGNHQKGMDNHKADDHKRELRKRKRRNSGLPSDNDEDSQQLPDAQSEDSMVDLRQRRENKYHPRPLPGFENLKYEDIWYSCNFCDKQMKQRNCTVRHIKQKHDPVNLPHGCRWCNERFKARDKLAEHELYHDDQEEMTVIFCEVCGISGDNVAGMLHHKMDDHQIIPKMPIPETVVESTLEFKMRRKHVDKFHPRPLPGQEHLKYDDTIYICNFCDKTLKPRKCLLRHMRNKHDPDERPFGCRFCTERYLDETTMQCHEKTHRRHTPLIFFCDLCGVTGDKKDGFEDHMLYDHLRTDEVSVEVQKEIFFKCNICKASFENRLKLRIHCATHQENTTKCQHCDETFPTRSTLRNHVWQVHDKIYRKLESHEVVKELMCCACDEHFDNENDLMRHVTIHSDHFMSVKCRHSAKPLNTFEIFHKHVRHNMKLKTHQCLNCKKKFPFDGRFFMHLTSHKRKYHRNRTCPKCNSGFRTQKDLEIHDKVKHDKQTLFICPFCAKSLGSETILSNHIKYVHNSEQEKKHECKYCKMKFTHTSKLVRHEATHRTERPHVCEQCGHTFKHKEGLLIHIKRHNGTLVKKFKCNQCPVKFTNQHRLTQHQLIHSGAKPHECQDCDRAYASKGDLVKHMMKMHVGNAVYRCKKCPEGFPRMVELREHQQVHCD